MGVSKKMQKCLQKSSRYLTSNYSKMLSLNQFCAKTISCFRQEVNYFLSIYIKGEKWDKI